MTYATRFAPSPTGPLHIGHAYSAWIAQQRAQAARGRFLVRIEDTDIERSKPVWDALIFEDLGWLGLDWERPVLRQSEHFDRYNLAVDRLAAMGLVYPCSCSRSDIAAAVSAPQEGATFGPIYPGTCRGRSMNDRKPGDALRLDIAAAAERVDDIGFVESGPEYAGTHHFGASELVTGTGDIVLGRKGSGLVSYIVASAMDEDFQKITEVVRGVDLFQFTAIQVLLMQLLGLSVPTYHHHRLIRDSGGKRLAKRDDARSLCAFRQDGLSPDDIREMVGL